MGSANRVFFGKAAGSLLLLLGDLAAKAILPPAILPIGAITSFLGAPLFLLLIFRGEALK